ncbi:TIGR03564 family F420-dependent LLM class oxidoreductase [Mycolicibacterium septicum DSM 44393]|uniref:TIGR03564 family F420-dependent LLM class oxidoreductase n=1 Tax=Mycolicibacterium septicum DSM 44393 TaxID=1341646 RepID=A0A7X6MNQ9_9MYCO|nr:TIGR03564 family F420-dependent LLM class oxidoreductase [Mycolicibacterium septicum]NKZ11281.1 TIGR03564 family F420-dependent LLM class oxidoreductase [Mycolicibacterium septicum DSM 44393]
MRIGLTGGGATVDKIVAQAVQAESDGFSALWYASGVAGDPLVAMALAGRATTSIELGTAVLQTYPCHPLLQANRVAAAANAMGRPGLTLGLGPSHAPVVRDVLGLSYTRVAENTEEYLRLTTALLRGEAVDFTGAHWSLHGQGRMAQTEHRVPVLVAALGPQMVRIAGRHADGVVLWMAAARAIEERIAPALSEAATRAEAPAPRIVAGLPVAVHTDADEARRAVAATSSGYANMSNYQRIIQAGGGSSAADVAIVGDEETVRDGLQRLLDAGATDIWAQPVAVGADRDARRASARRTLALLGELARS